MKRVLYTGPFRFPDGDAAAFRVYSVGKLFEQAGYSVSFAGWERSENADGYYKYNGHDCFSLAELRETQQGLIHRLMGFLFRGMKTLKWIARNRRFDIIVVYNPPAIFSVLLLVMCSLWKIRLILDSTEWYEGDHLPGGKYGPVAFENWVRMRLVYPYFRNVICISKFLEHYFVQSNVINVPPLMNGVTGHFTKQPLNSSIVFVYAGDAGRKDKLLPFIKALPSIQKFLKREILLHIAGQDWETLRQLLENNGMNSAVFEPFIHCHGRVSREKVKELYVQSHFSILFREDKRYARAGFPTKAMESWAYGCPIITNAIADLGVLSDDMIDAIFVNEDHIESKLPLALLSIISSDCYMSMSKNCIVKANRLFSIKVYEQKFLEFVARVVRPGERKLGSQSPSQSLFQDSQIRPVIAIDASRNRSGGAKTHLIEMLNAIDPRQHGIALVHVWSYKQLLNALPDVPWLIKHNPRELGKSLLWQVWWQYSQFPREIRKYCCDVLLTTDAGSVCTFMPAVVMSRDMLSFEPKEMDRYGFSFARIRLLLLKFMQIRSLRRATGVLFLTKYAAEVVQRFTGRLQSFRIIPHGIGDQFRQQTTAEMWTKSATEIKCVYVSNVDMYKHQWHVVKAIAMLRSAGHAVSLQLIGGGSGRAKALLDDAIAREDATGKFVEIVDAVPHHEIPNYLAKADIFIFASSCENMPNILIEAMASGLPIACSNRGPMPEILQDTGAYFDPENPTSIATAIEKLSLDEVFRKKAANKNKLLSDQYSWTRCAKETWAFLADVATEYASFITKCQ
jgi:glycosyltransferase involved in cell wall biosynthesis